MDSDQRFDELVEEALAQSLTGWDFGFVNGRIEEAQPSWNYAALVAQKLASTNTLLDMCTGGGEFLNQFPALPPTTYASEGYPPNITLATNRLRPRGVEVVPVISDEQLPLPSHAFDLIINRHGAYSASELARIAKPVGGTFLTQQVGSTNAGGLNDALSAPTAAQPWNLEIASADLTSQGFSITLAKEEHLTMSFRDIGAVVFYLKAIPWQILEFKFANYRRQLVGLHRRIEEHGSFDVSAHRFLIEAVAG